MTFAAVRIQKIRNTNHVQRIHLHGLRQDISSQKRADLDRTENNIAWSKGENPLDVKGAFERRRTELGGAKNYGKSAFGAHALLIVSPDWVREAGDLHDPKNPRNVELFKAAARWGEENFGRGSVIAARMDLDERGGGVVDLVLAPEMTKKVGGKEFKYLSLNKQFEKSFGKGQISYGRMQDSWAEYCQKHLDNTIERGIPKEITGAQHLQSDVIGPALEVKKQVEQEAEEAKKRLETAKKQEEENQRQEVENAKNAAEVERLRILTEERAEAVAVEAQQNANYRRKLDKFRDQLAEKLADFKRKSEAFEKMKAAGGKLRNLLVGWRDASPERLKSEIYAECGDLIKSAENRAKNAEIDVYLEKNKTQIEQQKRRETEGRNLELAEQNRKMRELLRPAPQPQRSRSKTNDRSGPGM